MRESRQLRVLGSLGQIRTATYDNRAFLVVPVVALMEGVIHAINAPVPEFVPLKALSAALQGWNGRPCVLGHPARDGRQISANDPTVLEASGIGSIFKSRITKNKLVMEAWIEERKVGRLDGRLLSRLKSGEPVEVSVGAFVTTDTASGVHNGKPYRAVWREIQPDHLAFLPQGVGACSIEMGCGAHRAAQQHAGVPAEGDTLMDRELTIKTLVECPCSGFTPDDTEMLETATDERLNAFKAAAEHRKAEQDELTTLRAAASAPPAMTEEAFMAAAPAHLKALIERSQQAEAEQKAECVKTLAASQSEFTEEELNAMPLDQLTRLARVAKVETPNFSGRALPRSASRVDDAFLNPPDGYALALKGRTQ